MGGAGLALQHRTQATWEQRARQLFEEYRKVLVNEGDNAAWEFISDYRLALHCCRPSRMRCIPIRRSETFASRFRRRSGALFSVWNGSQLSNRRLSCRTLLLDHGWMQFMICGFSVGFPEKRIVRLLRQAGLLTIEQAENPAQEQEARAGNQ